LLVIGSAPLTDVLVQSAMMSDMKQHGVKNVALLYADSPFGKPEVFQTSMFELRSRAETRLLA
jgi:hypothetical protein